MRKTMPVFPLSENKQALFWLKVDRSGGPDACWSWIGGVRISPKGIVRGCFKVPAGTASSYRVAWALQNSRDPGDLCVCHRCDNPLCCNPAHLFVGTASDNFLDAARKGRLYRSGHPKRRAHVGRLLELLGSIQAVAEVLGLTEYAVSKLLPKPQRVA